MRCILLKTNMWETEPLEIFRVLIDDMEETPSFSDEKLVRILLVAAFQVNSAYDFNSDYEVDIETSTLSPDPTSDDYRDDDFVNLMCLKAACILERGKALKAAGTAGMIKEFSTTADLSGVAKARAALLAKGGWCTVFAEEATNYQVNGAVSGGIAVLTPFRTYINGRNSNNLYD